MFSLVLHALRARRAQAMAMFTLAALAGLGAASAPWFLGWGGDSVARASLAAAPLTDRLVLGSGNFEYEPSVGSPLEVLRTTLERHLPIAGSETTLGSRLFATIGTPDSVTEEPDDTATDDTATDDTATDDGPAEDEPESPAVQESVDLYLATRTNICDHLRLVDGVCPGGDGEVALAGDAADRLGVGVGDTVTIRGVRVDLQTLRVSGVYEVADPFDMYWSGSDLLREIGATDVDVNPAIVSEQTLLDLDPDSMQLQVHLLLPTSAFIDPSVDLRGTLNRGLTDLAETGLTVNAPANALLSRIARDRVLVLLGVTVGAGQLVLLSWVGLFLAVRHTSEERRADIGLLKLRGTTTRRVWALIALSSGVPMLAGTLLGAVGGFAAAAALAHQIEPGLGVLAVARTTAADPRDTLWLSLAAAGVAGMGGLVAAVVAEWRTLRAPVVDLLRRVPGGHRGWRADLVDLVVVAVAVAGVYQGWVEAREGAARASVLALLAPALVGLAVALLVARALPPVAARVGTSALRAGRAGVALAALQLARRQGTQRVFTVLAVAAAVFTTMTMVWQSATGAWQERATQELGADRVLTVDATGAAALMNAVRSLDPDGRYAMAVATTIGPRPEHRVVAIDTPRYGAVGRVPLGLPAPIDLVPLLRPAAPVAPVVMDAPLTVDATAPDLGPAVGLRLHLSTVDGQDRSVEYPELAAGRSTAQVSVSGCQPSCRLVAIEVLAPELRPLTVEIHELRQPSAVVLDGEALGDIARWRTTLADSAMPPTLGAGETGLAVTLPAGPRSAGVLPDPRALPLTAPVPLPVALAGTTAALGIEALGGTEVPYGVVASVPLLPVVGDRGVLVDLEYALLSNDERTESADLAVWLTADAPDALVAGLADYGVTILSDRTVAGRSGELAGFGPGLALWFGYFAVAVVLLLAAGVALVSSTVDRPGRVAELVALRGQGLSTRSLRIAGLGGTAVLVGAAALTGVLAALVAEGLVSAGLPVFADDWALLPPPPGLTWRSLLVSAAVIVVVLGVASLSGAGRLVAAATSRRAGGSATSATERAT